MDTPPPPRVYGTDPGTPAAAHGPQPGHDYVTLTGGPLDGLLLDVTGMTEDDRATGAALISPHSAYGPGGRSWYDPQPADPGHWTWTRDTP